MWPFSWIISRFAAQQKADTAFVSVFFAAVCIASWWFHHVVHVPTPGGHSHQKKVNSSQGEGSPMDGLTPSVG